MKAVRKLAEENLGWQASFTDRGTWPSMKWLKDILANGKAAGEASQHCHNALQLMLQTVEQCMWING
jgi:hypothetical protein